MDDLSFGLGDRGRYPALPTYPQIVRLPMTNRSPMSKRLRVSLRAMLSVVGAVAVMLAIYTNHVQKMRRAVRLLEENKISFRCTETSSLPWHDRLPFLEPTPRVEHVEIGPQTDIESVLPALTRINSVKSLYFWELTKHETELLSQIQTIERIEAWLGFTTETLRPFMKHKLRAVKVYGPDVNIPTDALEMLYSIPTLKNIGTGYGESAVPAHLKEKRPDIKIQTTDASA